MYMIYFLTEISSPLEKAKANNKKYQNLYQICNCIKLSKFDTIISDWGDKLYIVLLLVFKKL